MNSLWSLSVVVVNLSSINYQNCFPVYPYRLYRFLFVFFLPHSFLTPPPFGWWWWWCGGGSTSLFCFVFCLFSALTKCWFWRNLRKDLHSALIWARKKASQWCMCIIVIIINSLTSRVVRAPHIILQPVFSIFPCSPLPSGTCRTPGLSIPWCCLPISSSVCLVFFPLSVCLARWFWPDLMNGKHDPTTAVCVSSEWSGGLRVVQLPAGSWHGLPRWWHGFCMSIFG